MHRIILFLLALSPAFCFAQFKISGKVIDATDKKPITDVSVFLSNTGIGGKTGPDGSFTLYNVKPGQYDLVASFVGYSNHIQTLLVNRDITLPNIILAVKTIGLNTVTIRPDPFHDQHLSLFKELFLGKGTNASKCKILNPDVIRFNYANDELTASSDEFMEIVNNALGYKIKYKLTAFSYNKATSFLYYEGLSVFEDLEGSAIQRSKWASERQKAYLGSSMHFLRALIDDSLKAENFEVYRLISKPKPASKSNDPDKNLTQRHINRLLPTTKYMLLQPAEFMRTTDRPGIYAINLNDCLYVEYVKNHEDPLHPRNMANFAVSIVAFNEPCTYFDSNGIITNPASITFGGDWGRSRVAEMLPVDYQPETPK